MIAAPNYTSPVSVKAAGPAWKPEITWRTRARLRYWRFFHSCVFINGESWRAVARLTGPMSGISTPLRFAATRFVEKATAVPSLNMESAMNPAISASPSPNPVLAALADQAICNATSRNPIFRDEFYDRMSAVMDATELLESILAESAHHEFNLIPQRLYGMVKLINRELKTVDALIDALKTAIEANPEIQRAIPNY